MGGGKARPGTIDNCGRGVGQTGIGAHTGRVNCRSHRQETVVARAGRGEFAAAERL